MKDKGVIMFRTFLFLFILVGGTGCAKQLPPTIEQLDTRYNALSQRCSEWQRIRVDQGEVDNSTFQRTWAAAFNQWLSDVKWFMEEPVELHPGNPLMGTSAMIGPARQRNRSSLISRAEYLIGMSSLSQQTCAEGK